MLQFIKYNIVQCVAYSIELGLFALLTYGFRVSDVGANVVAKVIAGGVAFVVHRHFTFRTDSPAGRAGSFVKYFVLLGVNVPLSSAGLVVLLHWIPALAAKICSDVAWVGLSFFLSRKVVFISAAHIDGAG